MSTDELNNSNMSIDWDIGGFGENEILGRMPLPIAADHFAKACIREYMEDYANFSCVWEGGAFMVRFGDYTSANHGEDTNLADLVLDGISREVEFDPDIAHKMKAWVLTLIDEIDSQQSKRDRRAN